VTYDQHLGRLVGLVGAWTTVELIRGLLLNEAVLDALAAGTTVLELAQTAGGSPRQVESLLLTLEVEDVVFRDDDRWALSEFGAALRGRRGWLEMLVSGYGGYFRNSERLWRGDVDPGWREMRSVGRGSVDISRYGALPMVVEFIRDLNPAGRRIVDIGCANADYLIALCQTDNNLIGIGVEPADELRAEAIDRIEDAGLAHRVRVISSVDDIRAELDGSPDFFVFGFVLHELHEQRGAAWLTGFLADLGRDFSDAWVLAVEADVSARRDVERMRSEAHLRGYYNPYYLLHDFTNQTLLTRGEWETLFNTAGLRVHDVRQSDPRFDPTGMEIGFALRRC
jgi:2-ketoarginine methyltransferase